MPRLRLPLGKLPLNVLTDTVLKMTGASSNDVLTGPSAGGDFAVLKTKGGFLLVSSDPITGVSGNIGWYAVNVGANDIATSGNRPQFMQSVMLLPEKVTEAGVLRIVRQVDSAAKSLGISVVGGHTEVTPGLDRPILAVTAFSFVDKFVTSAEAREGDTILMTKTAGLEGTAVIAREAAKLGAELEKGLAKRAAALEGSLSVVDEAVTAFGTGRPAAMHDCTEGGVLGAVYEMSLASGLGFELEEKLVPVAPETRELSRKLRLDPLKLIGSGSLLISVGKGHEMEVLRALKPICRVTRIGKFTKKGRVLVRDDGSTERLSTAPTDELWRVLAGLA